MNLKFLEKKFNENKFKEFITTAFKEFELIDGNYRTDNLNQSDKEHILEYKYLGESFLDDDSEVGVLILRSTTKNIENKRVGFSKVISKLSKPYGKETILVAIYHNDSPVWRLTFVSYDFKGGRQITRTDAKRYTYILGEEIALTTAKSRIGMLFDKHESSQELIEDIFSVEKVSREFFEKYKKLYFQTLDYFRPQIALFGDDKGLALFTKKLLGRIVFLYFLQKKGWLASDKNWENGDKKFLRSCFDGKYRAYSDFYIEILQPLFFDALNHDRKNYNFEILNCQIPYLNGGLFMRDSFDKDERIIIENEIFENIFGLFDQYNFTIIESNPNDSEVAIDPEMLGRIFEDLLEDRKEKGAFYTPRKIVHYMCQQSIENYLETKPKDKTELEYIKEMKILDPAIGSGAFPMGMLHEITQKRLDLGDKSDIATIKIETIQNSIYGVDIEPSAVEIAKLRFWLSIVVDEEKPTPLPNLAYKIMVGNSLISTINGLDPLVQNQNRKAQKEIKLLQSKFHDYFNEHNAKKKEKIDATIKANINTILNKTIKNFDIQPKLEMNKKEQKKYEKDMIDYLYLSKIIKEYNEHNYTQELFFYKIYFKDVMDIGGFDVVIGNPPYVRHEKIRELKPKLKIEGYKSYNGTADLYIYFFEQGYRLLKDNGLLSFITSNKYTRAKYGKQFREFILKNTAILEYIDFNGVKVFESATVDTSIFSFRKAKEKKSSFLYCDINEKYRKENELEKFVSKNGFEYLQSDLSVDSFSFSSPEELAIKKRIEEIGTPLKEWDIKINSGLKTGFNEAFIIDNKTKEELVAKNAKNLEIIQPLLRGKDIKKYGYEFANKWILKILYKSSTDIAQNYSDIYNWLLQFEAKLKNKAQVKRGDHHWLELDNNPTEQTFDEFKKEKIIYSEIVQKPQFTLDTKSHCIDMTAFTLSGNDLKYLIALLNSKPVTYIFKQFYMGTELGTKGYRYKKAFLNLLPIPKIPKQQQKPFEILVDYILFAKEQNLTLESSLFESVIDGMVYDLYFEEEMKRGDCFISDEVKNVLKEFDTISRIKEMYKIFKDNKTIQRGLIYRRVISVIRVINGDK